MHSLRETWLSQHSLCVDGAECDKIAVMKVTMYWTKPGVLVHDIPLPATHQKFWIDEILKIAWEGFDEHKHCVNAFITWDLSVATEVIAKKGKINTDV